MQRVRVHARRDLGRAEDSAEDDISSEAEANIPSDADLGGVPLLSTWKRRPEMVSNRWLGQRGIQQCVKALELIWLFASVSINEMCGESGDMCARRAHRFGKIKEIGARMVAP